MTKKGFSVRDRRVVKMLDIGTQVGLELGPLTSPVVGKNQANIYYLDHMNQDQLKNKYKDEPVNPDDIVFVDFVLKDGSIRSTVNGKKFDYVIASHVIEHVPDTITWLKDICSVLKPGGILSLVIPDKRFTFDIFRQDSRPSDVIGAYFDELTKPSSLMMYDFAINCAKDIDTASVWNDRDYYFKIMPEKRWLKKEALEMCAVNAMPNGYIDCHCHVYTPESFLGIIRELTELNLIDFEVCNFIDTQSYELEFFIALRKRSVDKTSVGEVMRKIPKIKNHNVYNVMQKTQEKLQKENQTLSNEIESLKNSSSWKATEPLRILKKRIRFH